ncbi:MAG: hypothetical protein U5K84_01050 [Alkalibacterium sp.]|nr:hypothetical protein [Alkalibacterium sp.]
MEWNKYIKELLIAAAVIVVLVITFFIVMRCPSDLNANREEGVTLESILSETDEPEREVMNGNKAALSEPGVDKTVVVECQGSGEASGSFFTRG